MRRLLLDHARRVSSKKRGAGGKVMLDESALIEPRRNLDVLALDESLDRLAKLDQRQARLVELRFFTGMSVEETAQTMDLSAATVKREWRLARAWLLRRLEAPGGRRLDAPS